MIEVMFQVRKDGFKVGSGAHCLHTLDKLSIHLHAPCCFDAGPPVSVGRTEFG